MLRNMKLTDGTRALVEPLTIRCNGVGCEAKFETGTVWAGELVLQAKEAGWLSDYHVLWNRYSCEYCPSCATDQLRQHCVPPTEPPEPLLGKRYERPKHIYPRLTE